MRKIAGILLFGVFVSSVVYAEGFQNFEQNASEMGNSYAGAAAAAEDASIGYFNPAGLILFNTRQVTYSTVALFNNVKFNGNSTWHGPFGSFSQFGSDNGGKTQYFPAFNEAIPFNKRFAIGLNAGMPFSFDTDYSNNGVLRYEATESHFYVIDITPSLAYLFTKKWSAGIGPDFDYAHASFDSIVGAPAVNYLENKGGDWGVGWHGGVLYQYSPATRFGVAYHSPVNFSMHGNSKLFGPITGIGNAGFVNDNLRMKLKTPDFADISAFHQLNPQWQLLGSLVYTDWNKLNKINLNNTVYAINGEPFAVNTQIPLNLRNTWYTAIGANYLLNSHFTLRGGLAYDESPATATTSVRIPDSNKVILGAGVKYDLNKMWSFDLGYQHWFPMQNSNRSTLVNIAGSTVSSNGRLKQSANLVGLQITWNIGLL